MKPDGVAALVARVPEWAGCDLDIRPLHGGITNRNFVVTVDGAEWVVRIPGERTELLGIDRANEREAAERAAQLGIGPPVLGELPGVHTLITRLVPGHHLEHAHFTERLADVVPMLRAFHGSGALRGAFPIHRVVEWHARDAATHGVMPPGAYERLHQASRRIEQAFQASPMAPVPCHNDLLPANVLFADDRVWLLDFEYAGMNDVFFDLGNLSINAGLTEPAEHELLRLYFDTTTPTHWARMQLMKVMSEFREGGSAAANDSSPGRSSRRGWRTRLARSADRPSEQVGTHRRRHQLQHHRDDELRHQAGRVALQRGAGSARDDPERGRLGGGVHPRSCVAESVQPDRRHERQHASHHEQRTADDVEHDAHDPLRSTKRATVTELRNPSNPRTSATSTRTPSPARAAPTNRPHWMTDATTSNATARSATWPGRTARQTVSAAATISSTIADQPAALIVAPTG